MKVVIAAVLVMVLSVCMYGYAAQMGMDGPDVGEDAPDFTLQGLDGVEITLSDLKGTGPVVLVFGSCT